jgi:site-specific DNA-methyltransferase (adenine-specific)
VPVTVATGVFEEDNLDLLRRLPDECVDLAYCDPPFNTGKVQRLNRIKLGAGEGVRGGFLGKTYSFDVTSRHSYQDDMPLDDYLAYLYERLVEIRRVLAPAGSLYLHLDWNVVHYARFMLDELFGTANFLNEIIWSYDYGGRARDRWARKHDNILWYRKGATHTYNRDAIDRIPYLAPDLVGPEKAALGKLPTDVWWMTIVATGGKERTGYPTQKPLKLVERIVAASSNPNDLVADFWLGSGTTAVAAARLGRRFVGCDVNPEAIRITRERLAALAVG